MQASHHLSFSNPNKAWAFKEVGNIIEEWQQWYIYVQKLEDHDDYNPNTCTEAVKDGWENLKKHEVLREKTLVFLRNNFSGYEFLFENWSSHPHEDITSRLRRRVPTWLHRLEILRASLDYAKVPDGFWKEKGKELANKIVNLAPDKAAEIATAYLKNPSM